MNELARRPLPHMTADEFLLWEGDGSGRKFHLMDGEVVAMSPASRAHGAIQSNLSFLIVSALGGLGGPLHVVSEGAVVPGLSLDDNVRVPDVVVAASEDVKGGVVVSDPLVLIEILSPGSAPVTRNNLRAYATLPSVREIALFSTSRVEAEVYVRDEASGWPAAPDVIGPGGELVLPFVGLRCPVEHVYAGTWLASPSLR